RLLQTGQSGTDEHCVSCETLGDRAGISCVPLFDRQRIMDFGSQDTILMIPQSPIGCLVRLTDHVHDDRVERSVRILVAVFTSTLEHRVTNECLELCVIGVTLELPAIGIED